MTPHYWPGYEGQMPLDTPKCGYDGSLCDYTMIFVLCGFAIFCIVAIPLGYLLYRRGKERMLYDMNWCVSRESVRLLSDRSKVGNICGVPQNSKHRKHE